MTTTIPGSDEFNWILGPVGNCVPYIVEEKKVTTVLHRALVVLNESDNLLLLARRELTKAKKPVGAIDVLLAEGWTLSSWAEELIKVDFSPVNAHGLVSMWAGVEVAVEDTIILILNKDQSALRLVEAAGVKITGFEPPPLSEVDGRRLFARLERLARQSRSVGEAYCWMLGLFGIDVYCPTGTLRKLAEVNAVRNCLLHRGGIVDERTAQQATTLKSFLGRKMVVRLERYEQYFAAIGDFVSAFLTAVTKCKYTRAKG